MNSLKVNLWGEEIGRLSWNPATRRVYFLLNPNTKNPIPDISPLLLPQGKTDYLTPIPGDERPIYQGLPPFISDSLPDSWGNALFDRWVKDNKIPRNKVTPLYKLMFIGKRGMGALEFEPVALELTHTQNINLNNLYEMSLKVLHDKEHIIISPKEKLTMQTLLAVGTSAGGRQMKAIIAIDQFSGEIRSGQNDNLKGFDYYILKFGNQILPMAEIECAYYAMAKASGIDMEECSLFRVEGVNHFLTRRFDRKNGEKIHVQTLSAINPEANSYEDIVATCRALHLSNSEIEQVYRRMVFNVFSNNTDDHSKNFSFLLSREGAWHLAPAYDLTYIFNGLGTGPNPVRMMSIGYKTSEITKEDLLEFAKENEIKNAKSIIEEVANSLFRFEEYAEVYGIHQPWRGIIQNSISENLSAYGYEQTKRERDISFIDSYGRSIEKANLSINSKGHYELSAIIDGHRKRRFVRQNMEEYGTLRQLDIYQVPVDTMKNLIESLLPPNITPKLGFGR